MFDCEGLTGRAASVAGYHDAGGLAAVSAGLGKPRVDQGIIQANPTVGVAFQQLSQ